MSIAARFSSRQQILFITIALCAATLACFGQVLGHQFLLWDDADYVTRNEHIRAGLSGSALRWAFTTFSAANWHPLTWLSHMLDCQIYGLRPAGHHLSALLLHLANGLLLFSLLRAATGDLRRSAIIAAVFLLHPLRVESVAWIAERKDVLSLFFGLFALRAYVAYAQRPDWQHYALVLLFFTLSLLAKQMLVTLPFLLILLDLWPLRRQALGLRRLLAEKIPILALAALASLVVLHAQRQWGTVASLVQITLGQRLANAVVAYAWYLGKTLWPTGLCFFYPHPVVWPAARVAVAALALVSVTGLCLWRIRQRPGMLVGWLWFLGTLVPVINLVQIGRHFAADRYTYFPQIGLLILVLWALPDRLLPGGRGWTARISAGVLTGVLLALLIQTYREVATWRDDMVLAQRALSLSPQGGNPVASRVLAGALVDRGRAAEAIVHLEAARRMWPDYSEAIDFLPAALIRAGRLDEGMSQALHGARVHPQDNAQVQLVWGSLRQSGQPPKVIAKHLHDLARVLHRRGDPLLVMALLLDVVALRPDSAQAHSALGTALADIGEQGGAVRFFTKALQIELAGPAPVRQYLVQDLQRAYDDYERATGAGRAIKGDLHPILPEELRRAPSLTEAWQVLTRAQGTR